MITLAVETSTITASCAIVEDGKVMAELTTQHAKTHSEKLLPMLNSMLSMIDKKVSDIDLFSASTGPGSFTGLRIGVVTIKSLAYTLKKPVVGVPTLDALAFTIPDFNGIISPILDARNNQVYTALYRNFRGSFEQLEPHCGLYIDEWLLKLSKMDEKVMFLGDALPIHRERIERALGDRFMEATNSLFFPRASSVALLGEKLFKENKALSAFSLSPHYLRKSQAERMKEKRQKT